VRGLVAWGLGTKAPSRTEVESIRRQQRDRLLKLNPNAAATETQALTARQLLRWALSRFDFDLLHDVLHQDKDYEIAYLGNRGIAKPGDLEEWFEDFQTPGPRDPERGFHR
jgi:hypothetical protein